MTSKENNKKDESTNKNSKYTDDQKNNTILNKLSLFELDDLFEEFDDNCKFFLNFSATNIKKDGEEEMKIDINQLREEWEDQEISDNFSDILKNEIKI